MPMYTPTLVDVCTLPDSGQAISNESHVIPGSTPYRVPLNQWPVVTDAVISGPSSNVWADIATARTVITVTVDGSARTLVTSAPSSGQVYLQCSQTTCRYSPYLTFHSSDAGKTALITYTGLGTVDSAWYLSHLYTHAARLAAFAPLRVVSLSTYNSGLYNGCGLDGKGFYVNPSGFRIRFDDGNFLWEGGTYDASSFTAFTDVDGWKRVGVYLVRSGSGLAITLTESDEATTQGDLSNPTAPSTASVWCGYIDVHGDSSGDAGGIDAVTDAVITTAPALLTASGVTVSSQGYIDLTWRLSGRPETGVALDMAEYPYAAGTIVAAYLSCDAMGSDATDLRVDIQKNGTSLFASNAAKPTIAQGTGTYQTDTTASSDFISTAVLSTDRFDAICDSRPSDCTDVRCVLRILPS